MSEYFVERRSQIGIKIAQGGDQKRRVMIEPHGDFVFHRRVMTPDFLGLPKSGDFAEDRLLMRSGFGIEEQGSVQLFQGPGDMLPLGAGHTPRHFGRMSGEHRDHFDVLQGGE